MDFCQTWLCLHFHLFVLILIAFYHNESYLFLKKLKKPGQDITGTMTNLGHLAQYKTWGSFMRKVHWKQHS